MAPLVPVVERAVATPLVEVTLALLLEPEDWVALVPLELEPLRPVVVVLLPPLLSLALWPRLR